MNIYERFTTEFGVINPTHKPPKDQINILLPRLKGEQLIKNIKNFIYENIPNWSIKGDEDCCVYAYTDLLGNSVPQNKCTHYKFRAQLTQNTDICDKKYRRINIYPDDIHIPQYSIARLNGFIDIYKQQNKNIPRLNVLQIQIERVGLIEYNPWYIDDKKSPLQQLI